MRFPFPADETTEPKTVTEVVQGVAPQPADSVEDEVSPTEATIADYTYVPEPGVRVATEFVEQLIAEIPAQTFETGPENFVLEPSPALKEEAAPFVDTVPRPRPKRKVIAFPRQLSVAPDSVYRLADPVMTEVPRILDVPEELEATPFLDGLQLDLPKSDQIEGPHEHVELPFRTVRV